MPIGSATWPSTSGTSSVSKSVGLLLVCVVWLLVGCASQSPSPADALQPPPFPGSAAVTDWRMGEDPPEGFGPGAAGYPSPRGLLEALLNEAVQQGDGLPEGTRLTGGLLEVGSASATAWVYQTGTMDDSVAGAEIRLLMRHAPAGWYIDQLSWRDHCRRGADVARDLCL